MNIQSFESELFEVMGLESHLEYDCSVESDMIYDDNFIQYTQEMVGVTVLMAASESVIFSMESEDNILVRFFKFIIDVIKKLVKGIIDFVKWIGKSIKSLFVPDKSKQEEIKTISELPKDKIKEISENDKIKAITINTVETDEFKRVESERSKVYQDCLNKVNENSKMMEAFRNVNATSTNLDSTSTQLAEINESLKQFDSIMGDRHRPKPEDRTSKDTNHAKFINYRTMNAVDYISNIYKLDPASSENLPDLQKCIKMVEIRENDIERRLKSLERTLESISKITEELEKDKSSTSTDIHSSGYFTSGSDDTKYKNVDRVKILKMLNGVKSNVSLSISIVKKIMEGDAEYMSELGKCSKKADAFRRSINMVIKGGTLKDIDQKIHFANDDRKAENRKFDSNK